jgi:type II secretory pathway component GspD/PulD (secretin)
MVTESVKGLGTIGVAAVLLIALIPWARGVSRGEERLAITAQEGRLSVDLKEAEMRDVLTQIGKEAGITVVFESASRKRVSVRFSDELEPGLRRLLGLAALNYVIVYAQEAGGAVAIREVRVLDAVLGSSEHGGRRVGESSAPAQPVSRPAGPVMESEGARRLREAIEKAR